MPSDPCTFTEPLVLGAIRCQWRAVRRSAGLSIERRRIPDGEWCAVHAAEVEAEVAHGTEAGGWLGRLRAAGLVK